MIRLTMTAVSYAAALLLTVSLVGCGGKDRAAPTVASNAKVECWVISQFNPKSDRFPKCVNDPIGRDDFVIVTSPTGHENEVSVDHPIGTTVPGEHKATAKRTCPLDGSVQIKETTYKVMDGSHAWVLVQDLDTAPPQPDTVDVKTKTVYPLFGASYQVRVTTKYTHSVTWKHIRTAIKSAGSSFTTSESDAWTWGGTVGVETPSIPWFGQITVQISGEWCGTTSYSFTTEGQAAPYMWRIGHYQAVATSTRTITTEMYIPGSGWIIDLNNPAQSTNKNNGIEYFSEKLEKKCP